MYITFNSYDPRCIGPSCLKYILYHINYKIHKINLKFQIGIVMFNEKAYRPEKDVQPCYGRSLAVVTQKTKAVLRSFVNSQTTEGNTNYSQAFEAAFDYFMSSTKRMTGFHIKKLLFILKNVLIF